MVTLHLNKASSSVSTPLSFMFKYTFNFYLLLFLIFCLHKTEPAKVVDLQATSSYSSIPEFKNIMQSLPYQPSNHNFSGKFERFAHSHSIDNWGELIEKFLDYCNDNGLLDYDDDILDAFMFFRNIWMEKEELFDEIAPKMALLLNQMKRANSRKMMLMTMGFPSIEAYQFELKLKKDDDVKIK
jgi:hypothetical protein